MSNDTTALTLAHVKRVGTDENFRQGRAACVVAHPANDGRDWSAKGAVPAGILAAMGLDAHPEPQKKGPKGEQKETAYGTGFRVLSDAVRYLTKQDAPKPVRLAVTMSGQDAPVSGTVIVPADHEMYAALVALIAESNES